MQEKETHKAPDGAALDVTEVLKVARERVARGWCPQSLAQDEDGRPTNPEGPRAVRWCLIGAIPTCSYLPVRYLIQAMDSSLSFAQWAAMHSQSDAIALFDKAIAIACAARAERSDAPKALPDRGTP